MTQGMLETLRARIDQINGTMGLFSKRIEITQEIGRVKRELELPIDDPIREKEQLERISSLASKWDLSAAVMEEIFLLFVEYSKLKMKMERKNG